MAKLRNSHPLELPVDLKAFYAIENAAEKIFEIFFEIL
jgi:hypothetical protein